MSHLYFYSACRRRYRALRARLPPYFDQICRRSDYEKRVVRRMDHLEKAERRFGRRHESGHNTLAPLGVNGRLWVRDHEENKELVHRSGNRRYLSLPGMTRNRASQESESNESDDVGSGDVKALQPPDDDRP